MGPDRTTGQSDNRPCADALM